MRWPIDRCRIQERYEDDGFVILRQCFTLPEIEDVLANLNRYVAEVVPGLSPMDVFFENADTKQLIRMLPRMERFDPYFNCLLVQGILPEVARALCRTEVVPHDAAYFNKLPLIGDLTPAHQDGYYFHLKPCRASTLWLPLDAVDQQNGCLHYVRGSHRRGMRDHGRTEVLGFSQGIVDYGREEDVVHEVAACVAPGDLVIHDALTIHRADANRSSRTRRALGFVFFSEEAEIDQASRDQYQNNLAADWRAKGKI